VVAEEAEVDGMTRIEQIEALLAAATPGPWHYDGMHDEITTEVKGNYWLIMSECRNATNEAPIDEFGHQFSPDFDLIANAPADLQFLLDRERVLMEALTDALEGLAEMHSYVDPYFSEKWGLHHYIDRARAALAEEAAP
jgi:hypothetical protein